MNTQIVDDIEKIADHFGFDIRQGKKCYMGSCPIHCGDNPSALNFYFTGHTSSGNWQCQTHNCHKIFGSNAIGFIRGLISVNKYNWSKNSDQTASFEEAIVWCENFLGVKYDPEQTNANCLSHTINSIYRSQAKPRSFEITNKQYMSSGLTFPSQYFINRGYTEKTLEEFQVGFCSDPKKSMYTRSVVPLHNNLGTKIIGCLGRSCWNKCNICKSFHNPNNICPKQDKLHIYSKWKNSINYPGTFSLYNFHRAKKFIEDTGIVLLTEGSPNVWRLFEANLPMSLSCNSSNFSECQKKILDSTGATTIIIVPDAGTPGQNMVKKIIEFCKHSYNIVTIEPKYDDDIGACNINTVKELIYPFVERYKK